MSGQLQPAFSNWLLLVVYVSDFFDYNAEFLFFIKCTVIYIINTGKIVDFS